MTEGIELLKKELGSNLRENVSLREYNTLGVGGIADFFCVAKNIEDLVEAVSVSYNARVPYFILGGGSNIVFSDAGFPGLVIKNESSNIVFSCASSTVIADSGVALGKLINLAAGRDLGGLEFLFGIPATVGGALYGNAGAFNFQIGDFVKSVTLLVPKGDRLALSRMTPEEMEFDYRKTSLKTGAEKLFKPVVLTVCLQLVLRRKDEILRLMQECLRKRRETGPLGEKTAGSFFKNPGIENEKRAGYLLEKSGAKKIRIGGASFSQKHANYLINRKGANALEIRQLADKGREMVKEKFGINLEEEVEYIGRW